MRAPLLILLGVVMLARCTDDRLDSRSSGGNGGSLTEAGPESSAAAGGSSGVGGTEPDAPTVSDAMPDAMGTGGLECGASPPTVKLTPVVTAGLSNDVVFATSPPLDTKRVFVVRLAGTINIIKDGTLLPAPYVNLSSSISTGSERGLLGLAFHPQYASNGRFFVFYTQSAAPVGDLRIAEYRVSSSNPDVADTTLVQTLALIGHSQYGNHNGGMLAFGPDGRLYAGIGDGGGGGDPFNAAQSDSSNLGKILRIDVDAPSTPPAGNLSGLVWDKGLRNPWRFSFDRANGDLYIGDVGQNNWEEIDYEPAGAGKRNYGWSVLEGTHCYLADACNLAGATPPIIEYSHSEGCAVTGGYVYRGKAIPCLSGWYVYGDWCTGKVRAFRVSGGKAVGETQFPFAAPKLNSFGEDAEGEIYLTAEGSVYRLDPG